MINNLGSSLNFQAVYNQRITTLGIGALTRQSPLTSIFKTQSQFNNKINSFGLGKISALSSTLIGLQSNLLMASNVPRIGAISFGLSAMKSPFNSIGFSNKSLNAIAKINIVSVGQSFSSVKYGLKSITKIENIFTNEYINTDGFKVKIDEVIKENNINFNIDEIDESERVSIVNEFVKAISETQPNIKALIGSISDKKYHKSIFILIINLLIYYNVFLNIYNNFMPKDNHYIINKNNVRIRSTPNNDNNKNIITKLNKNIYVEKLDLQNGWVKVLFELDEGKQQEGWVYRTLLTKQDN